MAMSVLIYFIQVDRPVSVGLPPIEEWKGNVVSHPAKGREQGPRLSIPDIIRKHIIRNNKLIYCCIYGSFVYILRYGIVSWAPKFLSDSLDVGGKDMGKLASMGGGFCF